MMANTWFTSDLHLYHEKMCNLRGFTSDGFTEYLVNMWNSMIQKRDTVYILGDFGFNSPLVRKTRFRLNGKLHLILGNHDEKNKLVLSPNMFASVEKYKMIRINKKYIFLCHYQMKVWNLSHYNSWHLFGHSHTGLNCPKFSTNAGKSLDVGLDNWALEPVCFDVIHEVLTQAPNNFNFTENQK